MTETVNKTLRLPQEIAVVVDLIGQVEGPNAHAFILRAIEEAIDRRQQDPDFQRQLVAHLREQREAARRLTGTPPDDNLGEGS